MTCAQRAYCSPQPRRSPMRTLKVVLILFLLTCSQVHAATVWYQPTPYPLKKMDGSSLPQDLDKVHVWDGWLNNSFNTTLVRDDKLQAGGWGDVYRSYLNWDLVGLPQNPTTVNLWFQFYTAGGTPTPFQFCIPNSSWNTTVAWGSQPSVLGCTGMFNPPTSGGWAGWNITSWYQNWQSGAWGKYGILINPQSNNNNFVAIRSSRYTSDGLRPILQFDFTPTLELKMPLPGAASWLLTNEAGGYECKGESPWPDVAHQGNSYFSLDFSPSNQKDTGGSYSGDIPIIAAANGIVAYAETSPYVPNGYHIVLNHSGSSSTTSGYTTKYLHLKDRPRRSNGTLLSVGDTVAQGDQIGIMGTTGQLANGTPTSTATHLHFGVYQNGSASSSLSALTQVVMDGWLLKSFQTECAVNSSGVPTSRVRYYHSSNRAY